jgi:hypothetical protein
MGSLNYSHSALANRKISLSSRLITVVSVVFGPVYSENFITAESFQADGDLRTYRTMRSNYSFPDIDDAHLKGSTLLHWLITCMPITSNIVSFCLISQVMEELTKRRELLVATKLVIVVMVFKIHRRSDTK